MYSTFETNPLPGDAFGFEDVTNVFVNAAQGMFDAYPRPMRVNLRIDHRYGPGADALYGGIHAHGRYERI